MFVLRSSYLAAYPRLQGYWGNQARTRGSWELGSKVPTPPPLPKTEKSADLARYFSGVAKFCVQNKETSNLTRLVSGLNRIFTGEIPQ